MDGPDLATRLNEIAAMQGRMPIDGSKIQDDGTVPLPEEFKVRPPVDYSQVPDGPSHDLDDDEEENLASPLIPKATVLELPPEPLGPVPDLTVLGNDGAGTIAGYRGEQVELSPKEAQAVRRIVSIAIARSFRARAAEFQTKKTRRRKGATSARRAEGTVGPSVVPVSVAPLPQPSKRKGRPRGSKNKPKDRQPGSEAQ